MVGVFFTADPHFGHGNIIKYTKRLEFLSDGERDQFAKDQKFEVSQESIQRMNDAILANINQMVGENDILWILGDFCFAPKALRFERARMYRNRIRCRHVNLVWGNHDEREIAPLFQETYDLIKAKVNKQQIMMCHRTMATWDDSFAGDWHLYGHAHGTAETWLEGCMPQRRAMDVGIDNAKKLLGEYRPFSFQEIKSYMDKRVGHNVYCKQHVGKPGFTSHGRHPL